MGRAGIVLGLEVSRLARNSTDWHRLLEICAITDTLILDEDGIYYPGDFNDRLLLGLKGTMSEAELHLIRARMRGGVLNKAKRGELESKDYLKRRIEDAARRGAAGRVDHELQFLVLEQVNGVGAAFLEFVDAFHLQAGLFQNSRRAAGGD